jgi:hypothetical protein
VKIKLRNTILQKLSCTVILSFNFLATIHWHLTQAYTNVKWKYSVWLLEYIKKKTIEQYNNENHEE